MGDLSSDPYGLMSVEGEDTHAELELHVNLLRHGRRTCHARTPACRACALRRMCPGRAA